MLVYDQLGRELIIAKKPKRIISLVPSITDFLAYLGLENEIVGITKFCVHPEFIYRSKTRVGGTKQVHYDLINKLEPDLIIANKEENSLDIVSRLEEKYKVYVSDINDTDQALTMMLDISKIVKKEKEGELLVNKIRANFKHIKEKNLSPRSSAYLVWNDPLMACGADTYINSVMKLLGYENVFNNMNRYPVMSIEELQRKSPEVLLLPSEPFPFKEKHKVYYQQLFPNSEIKLVNGEIFSWYGSYMLNILSYIKSS